MLRADPRGRVYPDLANVLIALRLDPDIADCFGFDEMRQTALLMNRPPSAPRSRPVAPELPRPLTDDDVARVQEWLQSLELPRIGREIVGQAVHVRAREFRFHPVKDYLEELVWDGTERLSDWLTTCMGAEGPPEYLRIIGRMFLISMVARIYRPGCKCDYMLILEGPQGIEKSRACSILAGDYFSDDLPDIHNKDSKQHLRGKWLIEVSELATFKRAESEALKAYLSRQVERYRAPYGHEPIEEPRQCVFIGSVNPKGGYLKDETGARRFWPIKVTRVDTAKLAEWRDQLFAEAVERFNFGEQWWPDPEVERLIIAPEQLARFEPDIWEQPIREFLLGKTRSTVLEICVGCLGYTKSGTMFFSPGGTPINRIGAVDAGRIANVLTAMGWEPKRNEHERWWQPLTR
jgi:predicted P-loop ATPase